MIIIKSPSFAEVLLKLLVEDNKADNKLREEARVRHALAQPNARRVNWLANDPKVLKHIMEEESAFWISQECADKSAVDVYLRLKEEGLGIMEQPANDNPTIEEQEEARAREAVSSFHWDKLMRSAGEFGMVNGCSTVEGSLEYALSLLRMRRRA